MNLVVSPPRLRRGVRTVWPSWAPAFDGRRLYGISTPVEFKWVLANFEQSLGQPFYSVPHSLSVHICTLGEKVPSCLFHERATDVLNTAPLLYAEDSSDLLNLMAADPCQTGMFPAPT